MIRAARALTTMTTAWRAVLLSSCLLAATAPAFAQDDPPTRATPGAPAAPATGPVSVEAMFVRATKSNSRVDPELTKFTKAFASLNYTGYDLMSRSQDELSAGEEATFVISGGSKLRVQLIDRDEAAARLRMRLFKGDGTKVLDTTVQVHRNRTFIVAGPRLPESEDVLIIPITARY